MGPLGSRGLSQLRCRESGLRAVKTSGPGAQGVLRVKGVPARAQGACQNHSKGSLRGMCTQHLWKEPEELSSPDECKASVWGRRSCSKMRGRKGELRMWQGERKQPGQHCRQQQRHQCHPSVPSHLTWHGTERALRVHLGLDGDDSLPLGAPALLALRLHLEDVRVVGQQVLHHHRVLAGVGDGDPVHLSWDTQGRGRQHHVAGTKTEAQLSPKLCLKQTACKSHPGALPNHLHHTLPPAVVAQDKMFFQKWLGINNSFLKTQGISDEFYFH